jgi:hypothetical protein
MPLPPMIGPVMRAVGPVDARGTDVDEPTGGAVPRPREDVLFVDRANDDFVDEHAATPSTAMTSPTANRRTCEDRPVIDLRSIVGAQRARPAAGTVW